MKNCLTFSIKYKIKHPDAKIRFEYPIILYNLKHLPNITFFINYIKSKIDLYGHIKYIFYPHFFIEHNEFKIDIRYDGIKRTKLKY